MNSIHHLKLLILLPICLLLYGCFAEEGAEQGKSEEIKEQVESIQNVEVVHAEKQLISEMTVVPAELTPSFTMDVIVKTGGTVAGIFHKEGDQVRKGDVLFNVQSSEVQYEREKAQLSIHSIQNQMTSAREKRQLNLAQGEQKISTLTEKTNVVRNNYDDGLATRAELEAAVSELEEAKQALAQIQISNELPGLETQLKQAQIALSQIEEKIAAQEIKAPADGNLIDFKIQPEMSLSQGTKVGVIESMDPIIMKSFVSADSAKALKQKQRLHYVIPEMNTGGSGEIRFIADVKDPKSELYAIELEVQNDQNELRPGMEVQIQLEDEQDLTVITIPSYSIINEAEEKYVFVINNNKVEKRNVQLGRVNEPYREVITGIEAGEMLAITNLNEIADGDQVRIVSDANSE